jgi:hypothetical protein
MVRTLPGDGADSNKKIFSMIDAKWIDYWAKRYLDDTPDYDTEVLELVGPRVRGRGGYDRHDLLTVGRWKARGRTQSSLKHNTDKAIHDITRMALKAELPYQHRILTLLEGVQVPTASALLMVWDQDWHTVIDVRAVNSLVKNCEIDDPAPRLYPQYTDYLDVCQKISNCCSRSLRTVDRALYKADGAITTG